MEQNNQKQTILIVDDETAIRRLLHVKLEGQGYHCEEAGDAAEAMVKMRVLEASLVLLDMKMPGKSGLDLLSELKTHYPNTSVIMVTAVAETSLAIQCMRLGADDYLCKPFNLGEVVLNVEKALEKRALELKIKEYQDNLQEQVNQQTQRIHELFLGSIESLVSALEAKDKYTAGHSRRVTEYALAIGKELKLAENDLENLKWGSLLHDVGKIAVDRYIQNKPTSLTPAEYEHIMAHVQVGAGIVKHVVNEFVVAIIEHHHDYFNGAGLHQVAIGEQIPLGSRILAVADAFDAMTSDRPYRSAIGAEKARQEIKRCTGTQFDPVVANVFLKINISGGETEKEKQLSVI